MFTNLPHRLAHGVMLTISSTNPIALGEQRSHLKLTNHFGAPTYVFGAHSITLHGPRISHVQYSPARKPSWNNEYSVPQKPVSLTNKVFREIRFWGKKNNKYPIRSSITPSLRPEELAHPPWHQPTSRSMPPAHRIDYLLAL